MKYLGQITDDEDIVNKKYVDNASEVVQTLTSGTKIGSVGGTDLFAPAGGGTGAVTTWYGTCSNTASATTKNITCSEYALTKGAIISVLFTSSNTADSFSMNVNSTGAKSVYKGGSAISSTNPLTWGANTVVTFMYDGSYYKYLSSSNNISEDNNGDIEVTNDITAGGKLTTGAINGDALFDHTSVSLTTSSIGANASGEVTSSTITNANYYPIAFASISITTGVASLRRFYFDSRSVGSCKIKVGVQNDGTSAKTISLTATILWVKTTA